MKRIRIPVAYVFKPIGSLKIDDVVYTEGKVLDVWTTEEPELWNSHDGELDMINSVVYITASVVEGEYLEHRFPETAWIQVLKYAKVPKKKKDRKKHRL